MKIKGNELILSEKERETLTAEFSNLNTIEQKYKFWQKKFNYSYAHRVNLHYESAMQFFIEINTPDEIEILNKIVFAECLKDIMENENTELENTKKQFLNAIEEYPQNKEILNRELKKIESKIPVNPKYLSDQSFLLGYENHLIHKKEFDWQRKRYDYFQFYSYINGREWAKYKELVEARLNQKEKKPKDELEFTHELQIIILEYIGFDRNLGSNTEKGKYYGPLINRSSEITRQKISGLEKHRTLNNLKKILSYFEHLGFTKQIDMVKQDIKKKS